MSLQQTLLGRFSSLESDVPAAGGVADALEVGQVVDEDGAQLDGENLAENDLIEASEDGLDYFTTVPASFQAQDGQWRVAPYYHLFGSDEMSQRAPVFQTRMPQPYIKLNPADAAKLGVNAGTRVSFSYDGNTVTLPVEIAEGLTAGQVGLPMGMPGIAPVLAGARLEDLQEAQQ